MPWKTTDPDHVRRPCCGVRVEVAELFTGSVRLPHRPECRYARRAA